MNRFMRLTIVLVINFLLLAIFLPTDPFRAFASVEQVLPEQDVTYNIEKSLSGNNSIYAKNPTLSTKPLNVDVGAGNVITTIEFIMGTEVVKTINPNTQKYSGKVDFKGVPIKVSSTKNKGTGGWVAWQRSSSESRWTVGASEIGWVVMDRLPDSQIEKETVGGIRRDKYPGYQVVLEIPRVRHNAFFNEQGSQFPTYVVDDNKSRLAQWNPGVEYLKLVINEEVSIVGSNPVVKGKTDDTTVIVGKDINNLDGIKVRIGQIYDHVGTKVNLPATGAAMMYYFFHMEFDLYSYTYQYPGKMKVYYTEGEDGPGDPSGECTEPAPGQKMYGEDMDPEANGVIKADMRGNEPFDVLKGIPTSESLYGNVWAKSYLHQYEYQEMIGQCRYQVNVAIPPPPPDPNAPDTEAGTGEAGEEPEGSTEQVEVVREYSFWTIQDVQVYRIKVAELINYAFSNGSIQILPSEYNPPYYATAQTSSYIPPPVPDNVEAMEGQDPQSAAEAAVGEVIVSNDTFTFNGRTLMDGSVTEGSGRTPEEIPNASMIGDDVLYSPGNMIPISKTNKASQPSTGKIYYSSVGGNGEKDYEINGLNSVTVHTPVVNYSSVSDDAAHNQKTKPNERRSALILERPFTVKIPTSGQHLNESNYPGYGNRDYAKYFRSKQVKFEFDVYMGESSGFQTFVPKGTWIEVPVNQEEATFFLPVWVDEGDYQVYFRNIAENAPGGNPDDIPAQNDANLDLVNHMALDQVSVEVIGRLYDFHITDIADYNWENVFRQGKGAAEPTGVSYWVGMGKIDGDPRGNQSPYSVLIRPGSHPFQGYKNVSIKTGYHFKFDLKTKGNMFEKLDGIRITPTFYFVSHDGEVREQVDLYYSTNSQPFVKIGSKDDKVSRYVILNERLRNVPVTSLQDTAKYKYYLYEPAWLRGQKSLEQYVSEYVDKVTLQKTPVGSYDLLLLPEQLRTMIGPKKEYQGVAMPQVVDAQRANASIQQWYGEYSLPAAPYIVKAGESLQEYHRKNGKLDNKSQIFLQNRYKNGYILVNFDIESIRDGKLDEPHLQYIHAPEMNKVIGGVKRQNQWEMEGFQSKVQDAYGNTFELENGDVVLYHANKSSRDDFQSRVTH